jgi:hypothetical protein
MKRFVAALSLIIGLHLVGGTSTAHAEQRYVLMSPKDIKGVGANCLIPDSFYLTFSTNSVRAHKGSATFSTTRSQKAVGRVITTRIRGERVVVTEFAASLKDKASCTYTFKSQRVS